MHKQLTFLFHLVVDSNLYYACSSTRINTCTYVLSLTPISIPISVLKSVYSICLLLHVPQGIMLHIHCITHLYLNSAMTCRYELKMQLLESTIARTIFLVIAEYINVIIIDLHFRRCIHWISYVSANVKCKLYLTMNSGPLDYDYTQPMGISAVFLPSPYHFSCCRELQ